MKRYLGGINMQDKLYIFNSSIKLLKEAAKSLENNTLLAKS